MGEWDKETTLESALQSYADQYELLMIVLTELSSIYGTVQLQGNCLRIQEVDEFAVPVGVNYVPRENIF